MTTSAFNPLDMKNLGVSIGNALFDAEAVPMSQLQRFEGAGMYAIFYRGSHPAYEQLSALNTEGDFTYPIYVGKADPPGSRQGLSVATGSTALFSRLKTDHAKSINLADNLNIEDFAARWLVVEPIWVPLGETVLIARFAPVWNSLLDGFGNHAPGAGRRAGVRPRWDTLHPGRPWAAELPERSESAAAIQTDVKEYIRSRLPQHAPHEVRVESTAADDGDLAGLDS